MSESSAERVLDWLLTLPFFQGLSREQLRILLPYWKRRRLLDGEVLCLVGEPSGCCWIVIRGRLEVLSPRNREVATVDTGGAFGIATLLADRRRILWARSRGETWLLELDRSSWDEVIARRDDLSLFLAESIAGQLASQMRRADDILRDLSRPQGIPDGMPVVPSSPPGPVSLPSRMPAPAVASQGPSGVPAGVHRSVSLSGGPGDRLPPRGAIHISEDDLEVFLEQMEERLGVDTQSDVRVVHSAEKPVRPKTPNF